MSSACSPVPSDCGSGKIAMSSCECSTRDQDGKGECLKITNVGCYGTAPIAPLTPQGSPTRRRPEEALLMNDLRRAREEIRGIREELRRMQEERDKWKNRNHSMARECYEIVKQHGLATGLSLTTLQYLDTPAAVKRLEAHDQHMQDMFAKDTFDLAATVQNIILEIQFVKTNMGGDTLRWRLYSALMLMQHISRALQKMCSSKSQDPKTDMAYSDINCDDYLKSTLKSADVQLLSTLNEVRERGMDDYYQAFRERFAGEYDVVHNEYALNFYAKTKALMIHMYSQRRTTVMSETRLEEAVVRKEREKEENIVETIWI